MLCVYSDIHTIERGVHCVALRGYMLVGINMLINYDAASPSVHTCTKNNYNAINCGWN